MWELIRPVTSDWFVDSDILLIRFDPSLQIVMWQLSGRWIGVRPTYRELLKSSLFVLFSRNQLRNSVLQKSSLFGFPQAERRMCDDVLFLTPYFANVAFRLVFAWKHLGVLLLKCCVACIKEIYIYIYMTLSFHWIIAFCKTTKRIGTLNFTNMNLPFVVINLIVCLSIAGHTTQGYTGSGMLCTTYLALGVPLGNR